MPVDRRPDRLAALRRRLAERGLDALLVTHPPNLTYLTGFTGSAGMLLVEASRAVLLTDTRYAVQAPAEAGAVVDLEIEPTSLWDRLRLVLAGGARRSLGFESRRLTVEGAERLQAAWDGRLTPVPGEVEALRVSKDPDEVEAIRQAAALALEALGATLETIRPGQTEVAIAARLETALRSRGAEWHPFPTIVASGPRTALPHAQATRREVVRGELLLIDFGARLGGYVSDLTRTFVVGAAPDARQAEVYQAVREAKAAGFQALAAGRSGGEADQAARTVLESAGLGSGIRHSLGHGIGLEVHEEPRLARTADTSVPPGAVVTVEPGAYFEGWGGIRLEDDVVVTGSGAEYLSAPSDEFALIR